MDRTGYDARSNGRFVSQFVLRTDERNAAGCICPRCFGEISNYMPLLYTPGMVCKCIRHANALAAANIRMRASDIPLSRIGDRCDICRAHTNASTCTDTDSHGIDADIFARFAKSARPPYVIAISNARLYSPPRLNIHTRVLRLNHLSERQVRRVVCTRGHISKLSYIDCILDLQIAYRHI